MTIINAVVVRKCEIIVKQKPLFSKRRHENVCGCWHIQLHA